MIKRAPLLWIQARAIGVGLRPLRRQGDLMVCWCSSGFKVAVPLGVLRAGCLAEETRQPLVWRPGVPSWGRR